MIGRSPEGFFSLSRINEQLTMSAHHAWKFFRAGGFDQVRLETGADLLALNQLDQKLWVALACPTTCLLYTSPSPRD